jgi:hypothetical protein
VHVDVGVEEVGLFGYVRRAGAVTSTRRSRTRRLAITGRCAQQFGRHDDEEVNVT